MAQNNAGSSKKNLADEAALLRQRCNSLVLRGHYAECAKLIEDNLRSLYVNEYWPENFFAVLRIYQKCYPALNRSESLEERLTGLLKRSGIPFVFARFLKTGEAPPKWNAETFKELTLDARAKKDNESALAFCELAIKMEPASTNLRLLCGWIHEDMGKDTEALAMYERALELNPSNIAASRAAVKLYSKISIAKALEYVNKAIEENPREPSLYAEKAALYVKQGKTQEAMAFLENASDLDPYDPEYPYQKAEIHYAGQNETAAVVQYKRAAALNRTHVPSLFRLAVIHEKKQPAAALEFITACVAADPGNAEALLMKASLMAKLGDFQGAAKHYIELIEADGNNIAALSGAAGCLLATNPSQACEYFSRASALEPENPAYHNGKADAHMRLGQYAEAADEYKIVVGLDKKDHAAYGRLAKIYMESDPRAAFEYINKALSLAPENSLYHAEKAELLLNSGKRAEAIESFNMAVKHEPGNAVLHYRLGILLKEVGNRASAVQNLEEAVNIDHRMASAFGALAELYMYSEPDKAYYCITIGIVLDIMNASFCYIKSLAAQRLEEDKHAREMLISDKNERYRKENHDEGELEILLHGECMKIAQLYIDRAVELAPSNNTYLCERAHIFYRMGQAAKALEQYQALLKLDNNNHEALYGVGIILSSKKDAKALEYFDRAIAVSPGAAAYHEGKGDFLAKEPAKRAEAVECYTQAVLLNTYNFEPSLKKAGLLLESGDDFGAMDSYRRTLLMNPNCFEASAKMGELLADIQPDNAFNYINHAVYLDHDNIKARMWRARILYERGKNDEAEAACDEVMEMCGRSPEGCFELAGILGVRFAAKAYEYAREAVEKNESRAEYYSLCGKLCLELGDYDSAGGHFREAMRLNPKDTEARELAVEYMYRKKMPEAVEAAAALADSPHALVLKARVLSEISDPPRLKEAAGILTEAVKGRPDDIELREELVETLKKSRSPLRYAAEAAKLAMMKRKLEKARALIAGTEEMAFEDAESEAVAEETPAVSTEETQV